ncbi:ABC transporter ATP-binding protein [Streptomyces sp. Ru73]|uniref:ABC transporter ATP-binding protein n=1 Tax=Streptomyces sp. Ru73 TaxID=2080748 RepID=UPI000CDE247C|nr:ABC transporter ATP-binding protein [Streptomyces sp. Ru73]POX37199.1 ABC transporter ATP-binding protein [Streptomyces sp. Ru73]
MSLRDRFRAVRPPRKKDGGAPDGGDGSAAPARGASAGVPLRALLGTLHGQGKLVLLALLVTVASSALTLAQPLLAMRAVEATRGGQGLALLLVLLAVVFLAQAFAGGGAHYLLQRVGESIVLGVRARLVSRLLRLPMRTYDSHRTADLISRVNADTTLLRDVVAYGSIDVLSGLIFVIGATVLMVWIDASLFLLVCGTVGLTTGLTTVAVKGIRTATERAQESVGRMAADLDRALSAIRTVKIHHAEEREALRVTEQARAAWRAGVHAGRLDSVIAPLIGLSTNGSFILVLVVGGIRVSHGDLALAQLVAFLLYLTYLGAPLSALFETAGLVQKGRGALKRIDGMARLPVEDESTPDGHPVPSSRHGTATPVRPGLERAAGPALPRPVRGAPVPERPARDVPVLELRDVHFAYGDRPVLRGVSLTVPQHSRTALVGPSGAGKSTVFALVARFYDPCRGTILLDGLDSRRDLALRACRARIGLVEQEAPVLHGTLRDNLCYGAPHATEAEVLRTVELANLGDLLRRLPAGLDTPVGDRGTLLSGGERQRVAIARALLPRPSLLLLDEPTSQMDALNEAALTDTLEQVTAEATLLIIAHRLSTVRSADRIAVLDAGRVRAAGTHDELLRTDRLYRLLAKGQLLPPAPRQTTPSR